MGVAVSAEDAILRAAISKGLQSLGCAEYTGPPATFFEVDGQNYIYETVVVGTCDDPAELTSHVLDFIARHLDYNRPVIWRVPPTISKTEPKVESLDAERTVVVLRNAEGKHFEIAPGYRVRWRFVQVPNEAIAKRAEAQACIMATWKTGEGDLGMLDALSRKAVKEKAPIQPVP
jgi:hypothetical protein